MTAPPPAAETRFGVTHKVGADGVIEIKRSCRCDYCTDFYADLDGDR